MLLWLLPLVGVVSSYLASTLGYGSLAKFVAAYPLLLMLTCCAWFYWFSMYFA